MEEEYSCSYENPVWTSGSTQIYGPVPLGELCWEDVTVGPSSLCAGLEIPYQLSVSSLVGNNIWDMDNSAPENSALFPEPTLDPSSYESANTSYFWDSNPGTLFIQPQLLEFHAPLVTTPPPVEDNYTSGSRSPESPQRGPTKPRWTSQNSHQTEDSGQKSRTMIQHQSSYPPKKPRPAILNSDSCYLHNLIERKYRSKLNNEYETLLSALPPLLVEGVNEARRASKQPEKSISKAEVLGLAKEHIQRLELEWRELEIQKKGLSAKVEKMKEVWMLDGCGEV